MNTDDVTQEDPHTIRDETPVPDDTDTADEITEDEMQRSLKKLLPLYEQMLKNLAE